MHGFLESIINQVFTAFVIILTLSLLYMTVNGGIFPGSIFQSTVINQHFDSPIVFISPTDKDRVYQQTTFNKNNVMDTRGALQVEYQQSTIQNVGVKTTAFSLEGFIQMTFALKADHDCQMIVKIKDKYNQDRVLEVPLNVTTQWQTFSFEPLDFAPKEERKSIGNSRSMFNSIANYLEFSVPPSPAPQNGTFWLDELHITKVY